MDKQRRCVGSLCRRSLAALILTEERRCLSRYVFFQLEDDAAASLKRRCVRLRHRQPFPGADAASLFVSADLHLREQHLLPVRREEQLPQAHVLGEGGGHLQRDRRLALRRCTSARPLHYSERPNTVPTLFSGSRDAGKKTPKQNRKWM